MNLPAEKIAKLAARKGVKRTAVENFLSSLEGLTPSMAYANLRQDAHDYNWNAATVNAISVGISAAGEFLRPKKATAPRAQQSTYEDLDREEDRSRPGYHDDREDFGRGT